MLTHEFVFTPFKINLAIKKTLTFVFDYTPHDHLKTHPLKYTDLDRQDMYHMPSALHISQESPITASERHTDSRLLIPGWGVLFFQWKTVQPLKPWWRICEWSRGATSSASSCSSGSPRVWSADDGWRGSSWASGPKACTSYPEENRAVRLYWTDIYKHL